MTICNILYINCHYCVKSSQELKGYEMSMIIKNAESLFERFESSVEKWANKLF